MCLDNLVALQDWLFVVCNCIFGVMLYRITNAVNTTKQHCSYFARWTIFVGRMPIFMRVSTANMFDCLLLLNFACKSDTPHGLYTLQRVRTRVMQGERMPVIHTVGFFAEEQRGGPGERFLRQLSALTGGTFQVSFPLNTCLSLAVLCCAALRCAAL